LFCQFLGHALCFELEAELTPLRIQVSDLMDSKGGRSTHITTADWLIFGRIVLASAGGNDTFHAIKVQPFSRVSNAHID